MTGPELNSILATHWIERRHALGLKPGTVAHAKAQIEFFMGGFAAAEALGMKPNAGVMILLAVGRDCAMFIPAPCAGASEVPQPA